MNSTNLKIIACITMLIDHIGSLFFEELLILRIIGRLSFPIFAYLVAEGFYHTRDAKRYIVRMFAFAILSEIPFDLAFKGQLLHLGGLNIFFTLFFALITIYIYEKHKKAGFVALIVIGVIAQMLRTDYGIFGVFIIFGFYYFRGCFWKQASSFVVVTTLMVLRLWQMHSLWQFHPISHVIVLKQLFSIIALIIVFIYNGKKGKNIKYSFYVFYPGHLLLLSLLKYVIK